MLSFGRLSVGSEPDWDFTGPMVDHLLLPWKDVTRLQNSLLELAFGSLLFQ